MTDCDLDQAIAEQAAGPYCDFRPTTQYQSLGLIDRPCSDTEMLQYVLEVESSRQDLQRYASEMNRLVDESAKATRQAEVATRQKSDFLAMMSHEIRTPLNGIIGMTAVLLARNLGAAERDCVETIRSSGEALLGIIDDILDFSKIEAGCLELECAEFDLHKAIQQAMQIVQPAAARKSIRLVATIDPSLPKSVRGDIVRLRQILLNLLSNAIKFTSAGTVELQAQLQSASRDTYELRFAIIDEGIGMTPEQQARLFRPFCQAEASTTRKFGGTGLGLAICKRLLEMMGGTIGVRSRLGEGSTFWFTLKVSPAHSLPQAHAAATGSIETSKSQAKQFRLLLVEDNHINQKVALAMLKNLGYHADVARNGREAVEAVTSRHYDLVFMDCLMPEVDGFEATRLLRARDGDCARVPIIAMTANAFAEDRDACLAAGMTDYLSKPVREADLQSKLQRWLPAARETAAVS
jgi:signal transduction histidine kinase/ActR/RegA family two-component response regulator